MAKRANEMANPYVYNKFQRSEMISDNIVSGGDSWDYSFIMLVSGTLPETDVFISGKRKAGEFAAWLCQEAMKRLFRFRFSKRQDDLSLYIKSFLADHQEGRLKRWIKERVSGPSFETLLSEGRINLRDVRRLLINEEVANQE